MARPLVPDTLWAELAPLLPPRPRPKGGRPPVSDRAALTGILFVLRSGLPWEMLPKEMGCGCGMTCWRRLLDRLGRANAVDWSRCAVDSAAVVAKRRANRPARTRPIAAARAPSVIFWPTRTASRSPFA